MTAPLTLLIVEDETPLAEMHAEYIRHISGFSQILLAGNLAQARMMIDPGQFAARRNGRTLFVGQKYKRTRREFDTD